MLTTNSGKLVPNAMIVNPMINGEILRLRAIKIELLIKNVDPKKINTEPNKKYRKSINYIICFLRYI